MDLLFALLEELVLNHVCNVLLEDRRGLHLSFLASCDDGMVLTFWEAGARAFDFGFVRFEVGVSLAFQILTLLEGLLAGLLMSLNS